MKYFFPYLYGFSTRAKTISYKISFLLVVIFPILFCVLSYWSSVIYDIGIFIMGFTAMYCIYEIGYIFNDTHTTKYEKDPTYRLSFEDQKRIERLSIVIISERILIVGVLVILLNYMDAKNIILFVICLLLLNFFYSLHNYYRSRISVVTMFLVVLMKYITVPILFMDLKDYWIYASILAIIIPVIRMFEYGTKDYCKLIPIKNIDLFRVYYYFFLTIISIILFLINIEFLFFVILATYFFVFRIISYIIIRKSNGRIRNKEVIRGH
jgi:hypothetical protein